jgi:hypothetical protein
LLFTIQNRTVHWSAQGSAKFFPFALARYCNP